MKNTCIDPKGHIINAHGQCQWCHKDHDTLEIERLKQAIALMWQACLDQATEDYIEDISTKFPFIVEIYKEFK